MSTTVPLKKMTRRERQLAENRMHLERIGEVIGKDNLESYTKMMRKAGVKDDAVAERLVPKSMYNQAKGFIKTLRNKEDPPPIFLAPPIAIDGLDGRQSRDCLVNVLNYVDRYGGTPVKGYKLWYVRRSQALEGQLMYAESLGHDVTPYVAQCHFVVRKDDGTHVDVTPPEPGDEGQPMIFIPSSRMYKSVSIEDMALLTRSGVDGRMGLVCRGMVLEMKNVECPGLCAADPDDMHFICVAPEETIKGLGISIASLRHCGAQIMEGHLVWEATKLLPWIKNPEAMKQLVDLTVDMLRTDMASASIDDLVDAQ
jgi:hypothetical protein